MIAGLSSPARLSTLVLDNLVSHRLEILLDSLEACSSLISLTIANASIENFRPRYPKVPLERLIVLPALTSLTVHRYHSYNPGELLPHLFTPKLASLALREFMPYALMDILARGGLGAEIVRKRMGLLGGVLETFFGRGTEIKEFFWECSPTTDESFLRVLNHLPGLSILHLKKSLIDRLAITGLSRVNTTCNDNTTPLCPKLQVLTFDSCPLIDSDSLYELLCSRSTSASSLSITTMDISRCELVKEAHVQKLRTVDPERSTISFSPCT
jgi:hypothetical protein